MGEIWEWVQFAEQDVRELRQRYLEERIQVSRQDRTMPPPGLSFVSPTSGIASDWFRSLRMKQQFVVRGAAAAKETRKAVLIGAWAAAQWGMWFVLPNDPAVEFTLPSGHQPSKSMLPPGVRFRSLKLREGDVMELDGVRVTNPLRTYLDLCRMRNRTNAWLAAGWLLERGISAQEIAEYAESFDGPMHPNRKRLAVSLPRRARDVGSFPYLLAYALLEHSPVSVRTHCELDEMGHAVLLAGNDLVIAVDEDPLWRELESEGDGDGLARNRRRRERWIAARGFRKLYFTAEEIEADPDGFVSEVLGATRLRNRRLTY